MNENDNLMCFQCQEALVSREVTLAYLDRNFRVKLPCCPKCGQVYISQELAEGRMVDVEKQLEDK